MENSDINVRDEIEQLIAGRTIEKAVHEVITYEDIHSSQENLWIFFFFAGYLKQVSRNLEGDIQYVELTVPNREVNYIYKNTVRSWFNRQLQRTDLVPLLKHWKKAMWRYLLLKFPQSFRKLSASLIMLRITIMAFSRAS